MKNYYEILNINPKATKEELKKQLNELHNHTRQRTAQGNISKRAEAQEKLEIIEKAMEVLLDDEKRRNYDKALENNTKITSNVELEPQDDSNQFIKTERTSTNEKGETGIKQTREEIREPIKTSPPDKVHTKQVQELFQHIEKNKENEQKKVEKRIVEPLTSNVIGKERLEELFQHIEKNKVGNTNQQKEVEKQTRESYGQSSSKNNTTFDYSKSPIKQPINNNVIKQSNSGTTGNTSNKGRGQGQAKGKTKSNFKGIKKVIILLLIVAGVGAYFTGGSFKKVDIRALDGDTKLTEAIYSGNTGRAKYLIQNEKANPNRTNRRGKSPLHAAIYKWDKEMVIALKEAGAKINIQDKDGDTPLHLTGDSELVELLLQYGADVNIKNNKAMTPLMKIVEGNWSDNEIQENDPIIAMLDAGSNLNEKYENGETPLSKMIIKNDDYAMEFIKRGADINTTNDKGLTPLHQVVKGEKVDMLNYLIEQGADINAIDEEGKSPLAYSLRNFEITKSLIKAGANVNHIDNKGENLIFHMGSGSLDMLKFLVESGLDLNTVNEEGRTALFNSSLDEDIVKYLVEVGGLDINHLDNTSKTPLHVLWNREVIDYLVSKGANINALDEEGRSPLFYEGSKEKLIELGADIDIVDNYERTALYYVDNAGDAEFLIELGLDVNVEDNMGLTPLHYALTKRTIDYNHIEKLLDLGANVHAVDYEGNTPMKTLKKHSPPRNEAQKAFNTRWHNNIIVLLQSRGAEAY